MGTGLKSLVAVTCLVVIATAGFWTWKALSDEEERKAIAARSQDYIVCRSLLAALQSWQRYSDTAEIAECLDNGDIARAEIKALPGGIGILLRASEWKAE
jgi:hypothetical protein